MKFPIDCERFSKRLNIDNRGYVKWSLNNLNINGYLNKWKHGNRWKYSVRQPVTDPGTR